MCLCVPIASQLTRVMRSFSGTSRLQDRPLFRLRIHRCGTAPPLWPTYSLYPSQECTTLSFSWDLEDLELLGVLLHDSRQPAIICSARDSYERLSNPHTGESCSSSHFGNAMLLGSSSASGLLVHSKGLPKTMGVPPSLHLGLEPLLLTFAQECGLNTVSTPPTSPL